MSDNFEVINTVHKSSQFKQFTEIICWTDNSISIFGSLVTGLLEVIIRKKINPELSGIVYAQFSKALELKTSYSYNEYFLEAYPVIENLVDLLENSSNSLSDLNEWLMYYLLPGNHCINNKVVYVFKNMLLALIQQEGLKYKIETQQSLSSGEVKLLVQEVSEYFHVCIKLVNKNKADDYEPGNSHDILPLIALKEVTKDNYVLLKANLYDQNGNLFEDFSFLYVQHHKDVARFSIDHLALTKSAQVYGGKSSVSNPGSLNLIGAKEVIEDERAKTKRNKSIEKLLTGFSYKRKSKIAMNPIQRSTKIQIIEGTHPNVILGISKIAMIEEGKGTCDSNTKQDLDMIRNVLNFYSKLDKKLNNLPAEIKEKINQLNCKDKLIEEYPSLKQFIKIQDSLLCRNCQSLNNPEEYQLFSCGLKCILCFPCRKRFSNLNCQLCHIKYSDYEKSLFNTLTLGY